MPSTMDCYLYFHTHFCFRIRPTKTRIPEAAGGQLPTINIPGTAHYLSCATSNGVEKKQVFSVGGGGGS